MPRLQRLAVLVTVLVTTLLSATTSIASPTSQAETRVWAFLFAAPACVGEHALEVTETHQGNETCRYDFASGDSVAARGAAGGVDDAHRRCIVREPARRRDHHRSSRVWEAGRGPHAA